MSTTLKSLIMSFAQSVDLYNFLLKNHHRRTAIAAYQIGKQYGLKEGQLSDLVLGAALHDIGALTISERDELIKMDIENPHPHARLGSYMLNSFEPFDEISKIIFYHHWSYDKNDKWVKEIGPVPITSYFLHVADRIDILINPKESVLSQKKEIMAKIKSYSGTLFHPDVVAAFEEVAISDTFWLNIENVTMESVLNDAISSNMEVSMNLDLLEQFAFTISKIIDSRSKFTISHSFGVSAVAYEIAKLMNYTEDKCRRIRVAGLLHDIGKIAISNEIIEKNGSLTEDESANMQTHAYFTYLVLKNIQGLGEITDWASHHHENHDGTGYPEKLMQGAISEEMDIISYADIYTALSETRPYREGLSRETITNILKNNFMEKHGTLVFRIVVANIRSIDIACKAAKRDGENRYQIFEELAKKYELETDI